MKFITFSLFCGSPRSMSSRNFFETEVSASSGHGWNQSMTTQLTSAGKRRVRTLIASPIGEKQRVQCRLATTCVARRRGGGNERTGMGDGDGQSTAPRGRSE